MTAKWDFRFSYFLVSLGQSRPAGSSDRVFYRLASEDIQNLSEEVSGAAPVSFIVINAPGDDGNNRRVRLGRAQGDWILITTEDITEDTMPFRYRAVA